MKKLILIFAVVAMMLPSCKKINEALDSLDGRLDKLEQETIPSIDEQISAINTTLGNLDAMDKELKGYIDNLTATASSLQEQINATNIKIEEVKTALQSEISTAKSEVLAQLATAKTELENELAQINATIETLKEKDKELDKKIAELRSYVDTELGETTDWVNATFTTLEQYNSLVSEIATIKEQIKAINQSITDLETRLTTKINEDIANAVSTLNTDIQQKVSEITTAYTTAIKSAKEEITSAYTTAIQTAITTLDNSLKTWVGEQLANYYTIAEVEAKITALQTAITDGDATLQEELSKLKSQLETTAAEITAAYKKAIEEAINTSNGVIDTKIANEIATINQGINNEVATINAKIAELQAQVDKNTADIAKLLARIQSVSYIPTYSDGKATVKYSGGVSQVILDFKISPKECVAELEKVWKEVLKVEAVYTQTRAVSFIELQIVKCEVDTATGVLSIVASCSNLSTEFFAGTQEASAALVISDGNNSVTSEYVPMTAKEVSDEELEEDILSSIPKNQIWYTTTDDSKLFPNTTNVTTFGAVLISNVYKNGRGILTFDDNVTKIGNNAFYNCSSLTSVTIPDSVTSIGGSAFYNCSSLTSVTIPNSVTSIGNYAFRKCTSLTSITIPDSVTSIGEDAFAYCSSLQAFYGKCASLDNRCLVFDGILNSFAPSGLTSYTIPDSVTSIGKYTFSSCSSLTSVTIPDSVTSIGNYAFLGCSSLTSVTIPNSVASIGNYAFLGCCSLTSVTVPDGVTSIGDCAFEGCSSLTSVTIPNSVTSIGVLVFYNCTGELIIDSQTLVGKDYTYNDLYNQEDETGGGWFYGNKFTKLTIGEHVTKIGDLAFYYCSSLTSVTIGSRVTSIGEAAFYCCESLKSVYCKATTPPTCGSYMFYDNASSRKIYVPRNSVSRYKSAEYWSDYKSYIVGYDF